MTREEEIEALAAIIHGWHGHTTSMPCEWCTWEECKNQQKYKMIASCYLQWLEEFRKQDNKSYLFVSEIEAFAAMLQWEDVKIKSQYLVRAKRCFESLDRFKETGRHFYPVVISREDLKHGC